MSPKYNREVEARKSEEFRKKVLGSLGPAAGSPKKHDLKTWPEYFVAVSEGRKPFEIRPNDRDYAVGDLLILHEFVPCPECKGHKRVWDGGGDMFPCRCAASNNPGGTYTGRTIERLVTYITSFGQPKGQVVMGLSENDQVLRQPDANQKAQ